MGNLDNEDKSEEENSDNSHGGGEDQELQDFENEHDHPRTCWMKCNERLRKVMINPYTSKRIKYFHAILSLTLFLDIIMTSLLIGSWEFQTQSTTDILYSQ